MRRLVPVPVKSTYRVLARGKGTASWSPWKVGRRRRHRRRREKLQLEYNQLSLRCQLVLTLSYGQFCSCRDRRRFHLHRFGRTRVVVALSLSPCCGGTARNRLPLLAPCGDNPEIPSLAAFWRLGYSDISITLSPSCSAGRGGPGRR